MFLNSFRKLCPCCTTDLYKLICSPRGRYIATIVSRSLQVSWQYPLDRPNHHHPPHGGGGNNNYFHSCSGGEYGEGGCNCVYCLNYPWCEPHCPQYLTWWDHPKTSKCCLDSLKMSGRICTFPTSFTHSSLKALCLLSITWAIHVIGLRSRCCQVFGGVLC